MEDVTLVAVGIDIVIVVVMMMPLREEMLAVGITAGIPVRVIITITTTIVAVAPVNIADRRQTVNIGQQSRRAVQRLMTSVIVILIIVIGPPVLISPRHPRTNSEYFTPVDRQENPPAPDPRYSTALVCRKW